MELTIRPEDLRPGVTLVDVLALLNAGADAAAAASAGLTPEELDSDVSSASEAAEDAPEAPQADADGHVPGAMVEGPQPPIEIPGQLALPLMMAAGVSTPPAATV